MMRLFIYILFIASVFSLTASAQNPAQPTSKASSKTKLVETTAWEAIEPLGLHQKVDVDTLEDNYYQRSIPSAISPAYACTGNLGAEGKNMIFMQQRPFGQFFLQDALLNWFPFLSNHIYYNSPIPRTQVSYNAGGGRDNSQERLTTIFTGNFNKRAQLGANFDYLYSKGSYNYQAAKHFNWGLNGSYIGDRYEFQGAWYHYNSLNMENGGITDDLYITDPAELQGGVTSINPKSIPTNLTKASTRVVGGELFLNNVYKVGYWQEKRDSVVTDSVIERNYVPVSSFIWTLNYKKARHKFNDSNSTEIENFFENRYLTSDGTTDLTNYWSLSNTVGVSLLEGFNKYSKFGLAAFATYETRKYTQTADTLDRANPEALGLNPFPDGITAIAPTATQNLAWVGAQLTKQTGSILTFEAIGEIGVLGDAIGEIKARGHVSTSIPMLGDTVGITGYANIYNTTPPYLINNYLSNHFIWKNDFSKERRLRLGGILNIPWTNTSINIGTETLQNLIYFNDNGLPAQSSSTIQVFSATLAQNFNYGILHWDNRLTYQTTSDEYTLPLPAFSAYSNLYIKCNIATLKLQLGIDCDYYTKYYAPAYQPALASFHNQHEMKLGNYPFMNAYANMKLGSTRFYVMMTHVNQGLFGGNNYFSSPHYPLNPRRFQLGLSVDFLD